ETALQPHPPAGVIITPPSLPGLAPTSRVAALIAYAQPPTASVAALLVAVPRVQPPRLVTTARNRLPLSDPAAVDAYAAPVPRRRPEARLPTTQYERHPSITRHWTAKNGQDFNSRRRRAGKL